LDYVGLGKFNTVVLNKRELLFIASFPLSFAFGTSLLELSTLGSLDLLYDHVSAPSTLRRWQMLPIEAPQALLL